MSNKKTVFSHEKIRAIGKELEAIASLGYNLPEVFRNWVAIMFYAFQHDDPHYFEVMDKYKKDGEFNKEVADHFAKALSLLMQYMHLTNNEALGELFMNYASDEGKSQFFTPHNVSEMMAKMMIDCNKKVAVEEDRPLIIADPTCGAGVMLVSAAKELDFDQANKALLVGSDIDITCVQTTALNMMFFNMNGLIIWGNPLSSEVYDAWTTVRTFLGGDLRHEGKEIAIQFLNKSFGNVEK